MPSPSQIDAFTQAFHQAAIRRLALEPHLIKRALQTINRWQNQRGSSTSDPYLREWQTLLAGDLAALLAVVCAGDAHAATLRNASPLGFVLTAADRHALRLKTMATRS